VACCAAYLQALFPPWFDVCLSLSSVTPAEEDGDGDVDQDEDGDGDVVGDVAMLRLLWHHWHFQSLGGRHKASTHIQNRLSVGLSFSFLALSFFPSFIVGSCRPI